MAATILNLVLAVLLGVGSAVATCPCCQPVDGQHAGPSTATCPVASVGSSDCCQVCAPNNTRLPPGDRLSAPTLGVFALIPPAMNAPESPLTPRRVLSPSPPGVSLLAPLRI